MGHFGDRSIDGSFQAIDCTDTDTKNKETKHHMHPKHKRETEKTVLANKTIYTLIWCTFYDL